jgi:hypothetical protein
MIMAGRTEGKYGKYIIEYDPSQEDKIVAFKGIAEVGKKPSMNTILNIDDSTVKGCHYYWIVWFTPEKPFNLNIGHPPHIHKDAELLFHIGTDPNNPTDLGAECEIYLGEEMERHVINKTCVVYIPPGFIHCPWKPLVTHRPWIFIEVNQGLVHTEKGYHQLIPKELQEKYPEEMKMMGQIFKDEGY